MSSNSTTNPQWATLLTPTYLKQYNGNIIVIPQPIFITIIIVAIAVRFWAKTLIKSKFGADDWLMIPSGIFSIAAAACCLAMVNYAGGGHHTAEVALTDPDKLVVFVKLLVAFATFYIIAMNLPKISMLYMFLQIFVQPWQRKACYILIGILVATSVVDAITIWNFCTPLAHFWNPLIPGQCIDAIYFWRWATFPNIVTDVLMIVLPIPTIFKIQLKWKDKIGLLLTFLFGGIGLVTSILRLRTFYTINMIGSVYDPTYYDTLAAFYSILEVTVYNVCACLPYYRAFYLHVRRAGKQIKPLNTYESGQSAWPKRTTERLYQDDDYQTSLHQESSNQDHSISECLDEKSADARGICIRSKLQVTTLDRGIAPNT